MASRRRRRDPWLLQRFFDPVTGKQRIRGGHDKECQHRSEHKTANDDEADRRARFRAGAHRARKRQRTKHHRAGRHQLIREFDDQDAVLRNQADQRHQPDLAVDVERSAEEPQRQERAGHRQRHRQHDDEGIHEALELRGQHEINEHQRQHEREIDFAARLFEFTRLTIEPCLRRYRERNFGGRIHRLEPVADRVARQQRSRNLDGTQSVEVVERLRRDALSYIDEVRELHRKADERGVLLQLPEDVVAAPDVAADAPWRTVGVDAIPWDMMCLARLRVSAICALNRCVTIGSAAMLPII